MKFVYVLEDDPRFQKEISEAIAIVDPKIQIRLFSKLEEFVNWISLMMTNGPSAIGQGGTPTSFVPQEATSSGEQHQLVLVISKIEFLGSEQFELLKKTRKLFIERKICTAEDPTAFVLTAFDKPDFKIREMENRILSNLLFKPFDKLILIQHLTFAIDGRHPPSKYTVANQKTSARIEMLKEVQLEAISDVGMVTRSDREIPVGSISKYYGKAFLSDRQRSLFAVCRDCVKHPTLANMFQCTFTFFSADHTQISNFRKKTRDKTAKEHSHQWAVKTSSASLHVVILDPEEMDPTGLLGLFDSSFENIKVTGYQSFGALMADLDPAQALQQRDPNLKALGGANTVTLSFDSTGTIYLDVESDSKDLSTLFGLPIAGLKSKGSWFSQSLIHDHKEKFRKYVNTCLLQEDNYLSLNVNENSFLVKVTDVQKEKKFTLTLVEVSKEEYIDWLRRNSKLQKPVDLIIATHHLFGEGAKERWGYIKDHLRDKFAVTPKVIMTTKKDFTDDEERALGAIVEDIFQKPVDRVQFMQKLKIFFPQVREKGEKIEIRTIECHDIIKSVNPVTVTEISEAGFVMKYYRTIGLGSFREIVLWQPYEVGAPELLATCNFVEENQGEKGTYNCHFVFFGITDLFLKHIRIWIRDNYVLSKDGQSNS